MARVGAIGFLGVFAMIATPPQACQRAGVWVSENGRAVYDSRFGRVMHRYLYNVDAEQCGPVVTG